MSTAKNKGRAFMPCLCIKIRNVRNYCPSGFLTRPPARKIPNSMNTVPAVNGFFTVYTSGVKAVLVRKRRVSCSAMQSAMGGEYA
jgi:hypothetical protein